MPHGALMMPKLELYPLLLFVRMTGLSVTQSGETLMMFLMSPEQTLKDMRRYLGIRSRMAPHRLTMSTGQYVEGEPRPTRQFVEEEMDLTLAQLGIVSNQFFFVV